MTHIKGGAIDDKSDAIFLPDCLIINHFDCDIFDHKIRDFIL